jgi:diguanylate cyclase (GGDEF)-like protein
VPNNNQSFPRPTTHTLDPKAGGRSVETRSVEPLDELLGVLRRTAFLERLSVEMRAADEHLQPLTVCLIDVDHLRNINDRHGNRAGDAVLIEVARRVAEVLAREPGDGAHVLGRFDGDALIVMTRGRELRSVCTGVEKVRSRIAAAALFREIRATISAGVAQHRRGEGVDATLGRLEQTLHLAKQLGRDRVESHPEAQPAGDRAVVLPLRRTLRA